MRKCLLIVCVYVAQSKQNLQNMHTHKARLRFFIAALLSFWCSSDAADYIVIYDSNILTGLATIVRLTSINRICKRARVLGPERTCQSAIIQTDHATMYARVCTLAIMLRAEFFHAGFLMVAIILGCFMVMRMLVGFACFALPSLGRLCYCFAADLLFLAALLAFISVYCSFFLSCCFLAITELHTLNTVVTENSNFNSSRFFWYPQLSASQLATQANFIRL